MAAVSIAAANMYCLNGKLRTRMRCLRLAQGELRPI